MISNRSVAFRLSLFIFLSSLIIFMVIFTINYFESLKIITMYLRDVAEYFTSSYARKIEGNLRPIEKIPQGMAYYLEYSDYSKSQLEELLRSNVDNNADIIGAGIAFEPYRFDKKLCWYDFYYSRFHNSVMIKNDASYNYFYEDWYQIPIELRIPVWSEPYYDEAGARTVMASYSVPFFNEVGGKRTLTGVVSVDVSLAYLRKLVSSIKVEESGYGFLISRNGTFMTCPVQKFVMNESIFSIAEERNDPALRRIGRSMVRGKSSIEPFRDFKNRTSSIIRYAPIPSTGWSLGVVFPLDESMREIVNLTRFVFMLVVVGSMGILAVVVLVSRSITRPLRVLVQKTDEVASGNLDFELSPLRAKDEVGRLTDSFISMRESLKRYISELTATTAAKERIESELKIAHAIQLSMLPKQFPPYPGRKEIDIYSKLLPARDVGGDFYDFLFIDEDHFLFVIGDVAGKGVPASLFMAKIQTLIRTMAKEKNGPAEILRLANSEFAEDNDTGTFVTVFCGILDVLTGDLLYTNGGHNLPLLVRVGREVEVMSGAHCPAVGFYDDSAYAEDRMRLLPGDSIFMYTDGITEAFNLQGDMFGNERLNPIVADIARLPLKEAVENVIDAVKGFAGDAPQSDDITVQILRFNGPQSSS